MGEVGKLTSKEKAKDKRLRDVYNMTLEEHNAKRAQQNNKCAICQRDFREFTAFQDHDHRCCPRRLHKFCGKCNRGLLCYLCNKYAVGLIEWMRKMDIPMTKLVEYLEFWTEEIKRRGGYEPKATPKKTRRKSKRTTVRTEQESI